MATILKIKTNQNFYLRILSASGLAVPFFIFCGCQNDNEPQLFQLLTPEESGIDFKNEIIENDTHNILNFMNLYTGSGVGIGDFNNDGLPDIFLGGNMESSRLYLNLGNLKFQDITISADVATDRWVTGVAVADVNADGWQDIYLSVSGNASTEKRKNLLFINQPPVPLKGGTEQLDKENENQAHNTSPFPNRSVPPRGGTGGLRFAEQAERYGLADTSQCTHANFFDYDKDGDLDLFMIVNPTNYSLNNVNNIRRKRVNGEAASTDKLYRNDGGKFTDVSRESGILIEGYSLSLNTSDLNNDGWPDIYVTNDFLTNDIVYINNQNGTFTNRAAEMLKHTSFASMGMDVADINNDGLPEIYVADMFPEDNYREKMIMPGGNFDRFRYILEAGYEPQYSRNTLQLNNGDGTFSEIGQLAGVHKTDWSWSTLFADFDNDGWKDLFITNGFHRDLGDLDYINFQNNSPFGTPESRREAQLKSIMKQPRAALQNYVFKNENGINFTKKSNEWGFDKKTCSHGAAYADLDLDGDLDLVINNVSEPAMIYENQANELNENHFLKLNLEPNEGVKAIIFYDNKIQVAQTNPYRGYQSTVDQTLHFGLGKAEKIDSLKVEWSNETISIFENLKVDTTYIISDPNRSSSVAEKGRAATNDRSSRFHSRLRSNSSLVEPQPLFSNRKTFGLNYNHKEDFQIDFKTQPLLQHQHSLAGPFFSKGDVNGDGLEDVYIGGAAGSSGLFFIQNPNGTFDEKPLNQDEEKEDIQSALFDADGDGDLDLYVVSGGIIFARKGLKGVKEKSFYKDRFYENDGHGNFIKNENSCPEIYASGSCVKPCDFDKDGDLDLFIGGRVEPGEYPTIPESYLLENDAGIFKNITPKKLKNVGMITDATWTDYDNDGDKDLMIVGEFMPITVFKNEGEKFSHSLIPAFAHSSGWWNNIIAIDFDNDGDEDYLAGNLGLNSNLKASPKEPVCVYANDFDKNGKLDPVFCHYIAGVEYPVHSRDELIAQIPPIKVRFNKYKKYASASFDKIFRKPEKKGMQVLRAERFESSYIENLGDGNFELRSLPIEMQFAPLNYFLVDDYNEDGNLDALAVGNSYAGSDVIGRYDAFTGALMLGDGKGDFEIQRGAECGFLAEADAKSIIQIETLKDNNLILIGNNSDSLQVFEKTKRNKPD